MIFKQLNRNKGDVNTKVYDQRKTVNRNFGKTLLDHLNTWYGWLGSTASIVALGWFVWDKLKG